MKKVFLYTDKMASQVSLQKSLNTCFVPREFANYGLSTRSIVPEDMTCFNPTGRDNVGREACGFSTNVRAAGCNSASEMILTENALRPDYIEFMGAGNAGIVGDDNIVNNVGRWDNSMQKQIIPGCCPTRQTIERNNFLPTAQEPRYVDYGRATPVPTYRSCSGPAQGIEMYTPESFNRYRQIKQDGQKVLRDGRQQLRDTLMELRDKQNLQNLQKNLKNQLQENLKWM